MCVFKTIAAPTTKAPRKIPVPPNQGWTLVELMSVLTIIALLIGMGVPSLGKWLQRSSESTAFTTLSRLCTLARTLAIKENRYYTLCASEDLTHCGGPWNKTLIVFSDGNKNEVVDADDRLIKTITLPQTTPCLQWNAGAYRQYLQFKPSGATNGTAGNFKFCDPIERIYQKQLVISFGGRTALKSL